MSAVKTETASEGGSERGVAACSSFAVLFLDVDGVLNRCGFSAQGLETEKCDHLAGLCRDSGCKIVVSSTWRLNPRSMERLLGMFAARDIECIGRTPDLTGERKQGETAILTAASRCIEIREWLMKHPEVKRYAIVDDDPAADDGTGRYVKTNSAEGLTPRHCSLLIRLLSS